MVKIDLITGFLGSGKTTFIKKYAKHLIDSGANIGILENDYGAVNVDMMLLKDLEGENCELEMIAGGCDAECHRRRFRTKLIAMGMCGYDRVIVEPSGIYDVDEFFDVLRDDPIDRWYEIGNVITVVDAKLEPELSDQADYLLASEAANAGCIVLSRSQEAEDAEIENTVAHLNHAMEKVQCKRRFQNDIIIKDWDTFDNTDYEKLLSCGYVSESYRKMHIEEGETFKSLYFMNLDKTKDEITEAAKKVLEDGECGKVFRVKGFLKDKEEKWLELNATHQGIRTAPIPEGQEVVIVIGEEMNEAKIRGYFS
nr:GTP-binding protein [uncultured Dorea sp.]